MNFNGKRAMIAGEGVSGKGAFAALKAAGAACFFYNDESDFDNKIDLIVVSPGIPLTDSLFKRAKRDKIPVIGEIELGYLLCDKPIVAVTGTNGKTTITELIGKILECDKRKPLVCGNIGIAFSAAVMENNYDIAVVEVSSFQLESIKKFRPDIAIISNITQDHLDRHKTMENYAKIKLNIAKNQTPNDYLITPFEVSRFIENKTVKSKINFVDFDRETDCYTFKNEVYYKGKLVAYVDDIRIKGRHNIINAMLAISACKILGADDRAIRLGLKLFKARAFRLALSNEHNGKKYYNDSKGTNIDACLCACRAITGDTCLIAGGSDKGYDFDNLFLGLPENIVKIYAVGETADKILKSAAKSGFSNIERADSIRAAVFAASKLNVANVLLSPATASFDCYVNYEERGKDFDNIVRELIAKK